MEKKEHECIHEDDFTKLYSDLEKRDKKIYKAITDINTSLNQGTTEFNKIRNFMTEKRIKDQYRNGYLKEDGNEIKEIHKRLTTAEVAIGRLSWISVIFSVVMGAAITIITYMIFLHIKL